jgi:hypothetical protein
MVVRLVLLFGDIHRSLGRTVVPILVSSRFVVNDGKYIYERTNDVHCYRSGCDIYRGVAVVVMLCIDCIHVRQ